MMGTWGTRIYEDDTALDVRGDFMEAIANGVDVISIENTILDEYLEDDLIEHNDKVILALCCAELETGTLTDTTKEKALEIIQSGRDYEFWKKESGAEDAALRKRELTLIRKYIEKYDGKPVKRKSWVELQKADEDFGQIKEIDAEKLDDYTWHFDKKLQKLSDDDLLYYSIAHIAGFMYWAATRKILTKEFEIPEAKLKDYKKLAKYLEKEFDGKLYSDFFKPELGTLILFYYQEIFIEDYEDVVLKGREVYSVLPTIEEFEKLATKVDERIEYYKIHPEEIKKSKNSLRKQYLKLFAWRLLFVVSICIAFVCFGLIIYLQYIRLFN